MKCYQLIYPAVRLRISIYVSATKSLLKSSNSSCVSHRYLARYVRLPPTTRVAKACRVLPLIWKISQLKNFFPS